MKMRRWVMTNTRCLHTNSLLFVLQVFCRRSVLVSSLSMDQSGSFLNCQTSTKSWTWGRWSPHIWPIPTWSLSPCCRFPLAAHRERQEIWRRPDISDCICDDHINFSHRAPGFEEWVLLRGRVWRVWLHVWWQLFRTTSCFRVQSSCSRVWGMGTTKGKGMEGVATCVMAIVQDNVMFSSTVIVLQGLRNGYY